MKRLYILILSFAVIFVITACKKNIDIHYDELPTNESVDYEPKSNLDELPLPNEERSTNDIIHDIILDHNSNMYLSGEVQACGFLILDEENVDPLTKRVTGFVSYGEYNLNKDDKLEKVSGSGEIPTAITFSVKDNSNYKIEEILTEDNFEEEVHKMFKEKDWPKVLRRNEDDMKKIRKMEEEEALKKLDIK